MDGREGDVGEVVKEASSEGGGVMAGRWRSTGGDVERWHWGGRGESAGVGAWGARALVAAGLDDKGREGSMALGTVGAVIGGLVGAGGCSSAATRAAAPSRPCRGRLGKEG